MVRVLAVWLLIATVFVACGDADPAGAGMPSVDTALEFERLLFSGDIEGAMELIAPGFTYREGGESIVGAEALREAFSHEFGDGFRVRVVASEANITGDSVTWRSIRYFPDSIGQAVRMTATFTDDLLASVVVAGDFTTAPDAIGCGDGFSTSGHADYGPDARGEFFNAIEATRAGFGSARDGLSYQEVDLEVSAPISGGSSHAVVRVTDESGYSVGFVFLKAASDGSLLIDAYSACEGVLELAGGHGDEEHDDADGEVAPTTTSGDGSTTIVFTFDASGCEDEPVAASEHEVDSVDPIRQAIELQLADSTEQGFGDVVRSIALEEGLLTVDFVDVRDAMANASTTDGSCALLSQLTAVAFQFPEVKRVTFQIEGSCETFFGWLQRECVVYDRP